MFVPAGDCDSSALDPIGAGQNKRIIIVIVENQSLLAYHQGRAGAGDYTHSREHLRLELFSGIVDFASQLERMRSRIEGWTDSIDYAFEHLAGIGRGHHLQRLADMNAGQIVFIDVGGDPDALESAQREELVARVDLR